MTQFALLLGLVIFSQEAWVSGMYEVSKTSKYVYVRKAEGLKVQTGHNDAGYQRNQEIIADLEEQTANLAKKLNRELDTFMEKEELKTNDIEKNYDLYRDGMSGFQSFPTYSFDEAKEHQGKPTYFQLTEDPDVVIRFKKLPKVKILKNLRDRIQKTTHPSDE